MGLPDVPPQPAIIAAIAGWYNQLRMLEGRGDDAAAIKSLFTRDEWQNLSRVQAWPIVRAALGTWLSILGAIALWAYYPSVSAFVVAAVVIGSRQHALNNLVHEAAHYSISRRKVLNDWISDALFATPHLISTHAYRQKHALHHSGLGDAAIDTERKPRYIIRGAGFLRHTLLALCGMAAYHAAREYAPAAAAVRHPWRYYVLVPVTNGLLLAYCWWLGRPEAYPLLWLAPLLTVAMYLSTLRVIAEHQPEWYAAHGVEDFSSPFPRFTRSIPAGVLERFFFGPVNFCYHHEHHLAPGIPFPNLPQLHRLLRERGYFDANDDRIGQTYIGTLARLVFPAGSSGPAEERA